MESPPLAPVDRLGRTVPVGSRVRLLTLSGSWLEELPAEEKTDVLSMIGEVFEVEEIDDYGHAWVRKSWSNDAEGTCRSHSVALEAPEMEMVQEEAL